MSKIFWVLAGTCVLAGSVNGLLFCVITALVCSFIESVTHMK
jgi:hypothetical protein